MLGFLGAGSSFADRFRIVELLSEGEVGPVLVAEDIGDGARLVLKVLHEDILGDPALLERFVAEVKHGVASEHVVAVFDAGIDPTSGCPWIAMERLEGEELRARIRRLGPQPPREVVRILRAVAAAIQTSHDQGRAHAGLTDENVFLATPRDRVKVRELGLARFMVEVFAREGELVGEPLWMAPEQLKAGAPATPAADVWAMALLAFWMLTGRSYWKHGNEPNAPLRAQLREIVVEPLEAASQRAASFGRSARIPKWFDAWFARCITRVPAERFPNAKAAVEALERAAAPQPRQAQPKPIAPSTPLGAKALPKNPIVPTKVASNLSLPSDTPTLPPRPPSKAFPPKPPIKEPLRPLRLEDVVLAPLGPPIHTTATEVPADMPAEVEPVVELTAEVPPPIDAPAATEPPAVPFAKRPMEVDQAPIEWHRVALLQPRRFAALLAAALLAGAALAVVTRLTDGSLVTLERGFETAAKPPPIPAPAEAPPKAPAVVDPSQLPRDKGQLVVTPALSGIDVYVDGERYGPASQTNVVPCKSVLVMLKTSDGSWKSRIRPVWIRCQRLNHLSIEPMAPYALAPLQRPFVQRPRSEATTRTKRAPARTRRR